MFNVPVGWKGAAGAAHRDTGGGACGERLSGMKAQYNNV